MAAGVGESRRLKVSLVDDEVEHVDWFAAGVTPWLFVLSSGVSTKRIGLAAEGGRSAIASSSAKPACVWFFQHPAVADFGGLAKSLIVSPPTDSNSRIRIRGR